MAQHSQLQPVLLLLVRNMAVPSPAAGRQRMYPSAGISCGGCARTTKAAAPLQAGTGCTLVLKPKRVLQRLQECVCMFSEAVLQQLSLLKRPCTCFFKVPLAGASELGTCLRSDLLHKCWYEV